MRTKVSAKTAAKLLKLAAFLRKVPKEHFNLEIIIDDSSIKELLSKQDKVRYMSEEYVELDDLIDDMKNKLPCKLQRIAKELTPGDCGAAGCAIGWCPGAFPHSFKWEYDSVVLRRNQLYSNFSAVEEFFDIYTNQADYLFMPSSYRPGHRGPKSVASRLEDVSRRGFPSEYKTYKDE